MRRAGCRARARRSRHRPRRVADTHDVALDAHLHAVGTRGQWNSSAACGLASVRGPCARPCAYRRRSRARHAPSAAPCAATGAHPARRWPRPSRGIRLPGVEACEDRRSKVASASASRSGGLHRGIVMRCPDPARSVRLAPVPPRPRAVYPQCAACACVGGDRMSRVRPWVLVGPTAPAVDGRGAHWRAAGKRPFVDLDALIEARAGRTVVEIFADDGEAAFRVLEAATLAKRCWSTTRGDRHRRGRGADDDSRRRLREAAVVVHLHAQVADHWHASPRQRSPAARPPGARRRAAGMAAARAPLYAQVADLRIDNHGPRRGRGGRRDRRRIRARRRSARRDAAARRRQPRGAYSIHIGAGLVRDGHRLVEAVRGRHALIVTDANVRACTCQGCRRVPRAIARRSASPCTWMVPGDPKRRSTAGRK